MSSKELNDRFSALEDHIAELLIRYIDTHKDTMEHPSDYSLDVHSFCILSHAAFEEFKNKKYADDDGGAGSDTGDAGETDPSVGEGDGEGTGTTDPQPTEPEPSEDEDPEDGGLENPLAGKNG